MSEHNVYEFSLVVPSEDKDGNLIDKRIRQRVLKWVETCFCDIWGGVTVTEGKGGWVDNHNTIVHEDVTVVSAIAEVGSIEKHKEYLLDMAECVKRDLEQNAVMTYAKPVEYVEFV